VTKLLGQTVIIWSKIFASMVAVILILIGWLSLALVLGILEFMGVAVVVTTRIKRKCKNILKGKEPNDRRDKQSSAL
jgi:hypothetical protein